MLSMGGRKILIKIDAQAIPTYTMSYFWIPKSLCEEMEGMLRKILMGTEQSGVKIYVGELEENA